MPIPIHPGEKRPIGNQWEDQRFTEANLSGHFKGKVGVGLLLGEPSGNLVDVDLDCKEAIQLTHHHLLLWVLGRA